MDIFISDLTKAVHCCMVPW